MIFLSKIIFNITDSCNLRCKDCYLTDILKSPKEIDETLIFCRALELKKKLKDCFVDIFELIGGEVTLISPLCLSRIINLFSDITNLIVIQTNGILLTEQYVKTIYETLNDNVKLFFSVSIDGPQNINDMYRGKGTYNKIVTNIHALMDFGIQVGGYGVLRNELKDFSIFSKWINNLDFQWSFQLQYNESDNLNQFACKLVDYNMEYHFNEYIPWLCTSKGNNCFSLNFTCDGCTVCDRVYTVITGEDIKILKDKRIVYFNEQTDCDFCEIKSICNGGCPAWRVNNKSVNCEFLKTIYKCVSKRDNISIYELIQRNLGMTRFTVKTIGEIRESYKSNKNSHNICM